MCGPIQAIYAVAQIAQMQQQAAYAQAVNDQQAAVQARNAEIAKDSFNNQSKAVNARTLEEREQAAAKLAEVNKRGLKSAGTLRATAGGMGGGSLAHAYQDVKRQELAYRFGTERSLKFGEDQAERAKAGLRAGRAAQELRGVYTPMMEPNFLVGLGRIAAGTAGLDHQLTS